MIIIRLILLIVMVILLFCAGVAGYAFLLMKKRSPLEFYKERSMQPDYIFLSQIPKRHVELLLALEDREFYTHSGFLFSSIWDALKKNIKARKIITGGSTITQQLAKNLYFRFYRNYLRKAAELVIVRELERNRAWCFSSRDNDHRAVTIECASDKTEPFAFREIVYQTLIKLCVDICRRNGKKRLLWLGDRNMTLEYSPSADEMLLSVHCWFKNKSCPGSWMYSRMGDLAGQVTAELNPQNE